MDGHRGQQVAFLKLEVGALLPDDLESDVLERLEDLPLS